MQTARGIRRRGWVLVIAGGVLFAFMTWLIVVVARIMGHSRDPGATTRFSGDAMEAAIVLGILGLVWVFGLTAVASGTWLVRNGMRNRNLLKVTLGLWFALMVVGLLVEILD